MILKGAEIARYLARPDPTRPGLLIYGQDAMRVALKRAEAVKALEKGKFTEDPVKTQYGYHIIVLEDVRPIEPPPFDQVKPGLTQQLQQQALKKNLDDIKAKAKISVVAAPEAKPEAAPEAAPAVAPAAEAPAPEAAPAAKPEAASATKPEAAPAAK